MDVQAYASVVAEHETGSPVYALKRGVDWVEAGEREEMVTTDPPLEEDEDAVYVQQEGVDGLYTRAFYAADDRDPAEIAVTVENADGSYPVAPLQDALAPFLADTTLEEAVAAVEDAVARFEKGSMDTISL